MFKKRKGQSILEYVIILIAIVAVIIWAANNIIGGSSGAVNKGLNDAKTAIERSADELAK